MSNYKHNCTKGPVKWKGRMLIGNERHDGSALLGTVICNEGEHFPKDDERAANAELIAEAFNVLHETGKTPRELVHTLRMVWNREGALPKSIAVSNIDVVDGRIGPYEDDLTECIANILGL